MGRRGMVSGRVGRALFQQDSNAALRSPKQPESPPPRTHHDFAVCEKVPAVADPNDVIIYDDALDEDRARKALLGSGDAYVASETGR